MVQLRRLYYNKKNTTTITTTITNTINDTTITTTNTITIISSIIIIITITITITYQMLPPFFQLSHFFVTVGKHHQCYRMSPLRHRT